LTAIIKIQEASASGDLLPDHQPVEGAIIAAGWPGFFVGSNNGFLFSFNIFLETFDVGSRLNLYQR